MFSLRKSQQYGDSALLTSKLFDQTTFYPALLGDLKQAQNQVIIESPFITTKRVNRLLPTLRQLRNNNVQIVINTKPLGEHEPALYIQTERAVRLFQELDILVLFTGGHHRKVVLVDRQITWEGSLNVLSQYDSCEFMRRIDSKQVAEQTLDFLSLKDFIG